MINYKLAKKLKEAGFPQNVKSGSILCKHLVSPMDGTHIIHNYDCDYVKDGMYFPTLSELIEACGDRFDSLNKYQDGWEAWADRDETSGIFKLGKSAEEAVANLWLELNKK
jgi:hypothetical protein